MRALAWISAAASLLASLAYLLTRDWVTALWAFNCALFSFSAAVERRS